MMAKSWSTLNTIKLYVKSEAWQTEFTKPWPSLDQAMFKSLSSLDQPKMQKKMKEPGWTMLGSALA